MRYEFHPDALAEYEDAARYYADCQEGLEFRFIAAVEHTVRQILEAPERWRILEDDIRWCLTRVFPLCCALYHRKDYVLIKKMNCLEYGETMT